MILSVDTSDRLKVRVALKERGRIVEELEEENQYGSQVLLPLIVKILALQGRILQALTGVEIDGGPGSFTGLRVGASVAQALGFALKIPVNGKINQPVNIRY